MSLDYNTKLNAVVNALKNANTTTSSPYLSDSLTSAINSNNITTADVETIAMRNDNFPAIFVRISDREEDFASLGDTGLNGKRKQADILYDITAIYKKDGAWSKNETLLIEAYNLARNIESVLRQNITLSNTALWCNAESTRFLDTDADDGIWIKGCKITLRAKYHFQ